MSDIDLGRVKENVSTMVQKGAPEADIDAYIKQEGTTVDAVKSYESAPKDKPVAYGRGQLPIPGGTPMLPTKEDALDAAMMIPAFGTEAGMLKGASMLENMATKAYPKIAQTMAEGKIIPTLEKGAKLATAGGAGGAVYGEGTGTGAGQGAALGAIGATVVPGAVSGVSKSYGALKDYLQRELPGTIDNQAVQKILGKFEKDQKGGGLSAQQALELVDEARKTGKPMTVADVGGKNVKGLAGSVARAPGASGEIAQGFLSKRDAAASERLMKDVNKYLSSDSGRQTTKALAEQRSVEARPLFEEAYKGGSMAPLESQFTNTWQQAAAVTSDAQKAVDKIAPRLTMLKAKLSQTSNIYQHAAITSELQAAQKELSEKQAKLAQVKMEEAEAHQVLQQAQADRSANAPGAIWNPRIQRLLQLPEVKKGINEGIRLERLNSAADGRAFNATEYAIVGMDKEGNPIVGKVPNMRLLASAKEGLDSLLEGKEMRDEVTGRLTKIGVAVDKVRRSLRQELIDANPKYKDAMDVWAGHSQSMDAIRYGRRIFNENPEEIASEISQMTPSEKEFAKLGVADMVRERIGKTGFHGDEAKAIIKSDWAKKQLRPFFKSDSEFNGFVKAVTDERTMFESGVKMKGNSATAERGAEDAENSNNALTWMDVGMKAVKGHPIQAYRAIFDAWEASKGKNEKLNEAVAKILFNPNIPTDALKRNVTLGEPEQSIVSKAAPYVGLGLGNELTSLDHAAQ